jgi:hypothetical protein
MSLPDLLPALRPVLAEFERLGIANQIVLDQPVVDGALGSPGKSR